MTVGLSELPLPVMEDLKATHSARVAAANSLLDRGHGKATQHIEADINVYEDLSFDEREAMLGTLPARLRYVRQRFTPRSGLQGDGQLGGIGRGSMVQKSSGLEGPF